MRGVLYKCLSLEEQTEQFGLPSQMRECQERACARGCVSVEKLIDDGYLGGDLDQPRAD